MNREFFDRQVFMLDKTSLTLIRFPPFTMIPGCSLTILSSLQSNCMVHVI